MSCRELWKRIPATFKKCCSYSNFWGTYQKVFSSNSHTSVGKESGETAYVERWNNTLRQRLARFVRKTLSFSKSDFFHEAALKLYLHYYNSVWSRLWPKKVHDCEACLSGQASKEQR